MTDRAPRPPTQKEAVRLADRLALSVKEAATVVGVSERHLRGLLPEIPHTYLGARIVIPKDAFNRWLNQRAEAKAGRVDSAVSEILDSIRG
jgi:excisionase family DNA binding protein